MEEESYFDWKLINKDGELIQYVNCVYDAIDIGSMLYGASEMKIYFDKMEAVIEVSEDVL